MREAIWLILAGALLTAGYISGGVQEVFAGDPTGLVWVISALAAGATATASRWPGLIDFLCDKSVLVMLGFIGTVIGFRAGIVGIVENDDPAKLAGIDLALVTTLAGAVAHLWLEAVRGASRR